MMVAMVLLRCRRRGGSKASMFCAASFLRDILLIYNTFVTVSIKINGQLITDILLSNPGGEQFVQIADAMGLG